MQCRQVRASTNKAAGEGDLSAPAIAGEGDHPEGVVEGAQDSKFLRGESNDGVRRFIDIAVQFRRRNAHHCHAVFLQPSVTQFVVVRPIAHVVAYAVDLDGEMCFRAIEVEHVRSDRMWAAEDWLPRETCAQAIPQAHFRHGKFAPEILCASDRPRWRSHVPLGRRPLHHGSLASRAPVVPLPRCRGGGRFITPLSVPGRLSIGRARRGCSSWRGG